MKNEAVSCGDPGAAVEAAKQMYLNGVAPAPYTFLSSTVLLCQPGYSWTDGSTAQNFTCEAHKNWTSLQSCQGLYIHTF